MKKCCLLLMFLALATSAHGQTPAYIGDALANPDRPEQDLFRDESSKPAEVLTFFGLEPGMSVLDYQSGGGYWSEIIYYIVGEEGRVVSHTDVPYAQFVDEDREERFGNERLPAVEILVSEVADMKLEESAYDLIFMGLVYHDIYYVSDFWPEVDRDHYLGQLYAALRPGGVLAVIDHAADPGSGTRDTQEVHRIDPEFARRDLEDAGFVFEAESDVLRNPGDDRSKSVFDEEVRRKTDRFVYRFRKPE